MISNTFRRDDEADVIFWNHYGSSDFQYVYFGNSSLNVSWILNEPCLSLGRSVAVHRSGLQALVTDEPFRAQLPRAHHASAARRRLPLQKHPSATTADIILQNHFFRPTSISFAAAYDQYGHEAIMDDDGGGGQQPSQKLVHVSNRNRSVAVFTCPAATDQILLRSTAASTPNRGQTPATHSVSKKCQASAMASHSQLIRRHQTEELSQHRSRPDSLYLLSSFPAASAASAASRHQTVTTRAASHQRRHHQRPRLWFVALWQP